MPAIVGPIQIINVGGGTVHFGDSLFISPKSNLKSANGQGASNTGGFILTNNGFNFNNVMDTNLLDQINAGNN